MWLAGGRLFARLLGNPVSAMKSNTSLIKSLVVAALFGAAVPLLADGVSGDAASKSPTDGAAAGSDKEAEPKIDGIVIPRAKGGFLGLTLENSNFKLAFFDEKKLPVAADVSRVALRWPVGYSVNNEHAVLLPSDDGTAMTSSKFVRPPYAFKLYMTLIVDGSDAPAETYVIDFRQ
jgi:hypothetical protein